MKSNIFSSIQNAQNGMGKIHDRVDQALARRQESKAEVEEEEEEEEREEKEEGDEKEKAIAKKFLLLVRAFVLLHSKLKLYEMDAFLSWTKTSFP